MKGDFSRGSFERSRYSRVLLQQGRAQVDSDWNEQQAIVDRRVRTALEDLFGAGDLIGVAVTPRRDAGFGIHVHHGTRFPLHDPAAALHAAIDRSRPFHIQLWLRPDAPSEPKSRNSRTILTATLSNDDPFLSVSVLPDGSACFSIHGSNGQSWSVTSMRELATDHYSFLVCAFTGDAIELWIDANREARTGVTVPAEHSTVQWSIGGATPLPGSDPFSGVIESLDVYGGLDENPQGGRVFGPQLTEAFLERGNDRERQDTTLAQHRVLHWRAHGETTAELCVGPGRCYVDGVLCDNAIHRPPAGFPSSFYDILNLDVPSDAEKSDRLYLAFVDVWDRYVSAYEDRRLLEPALGGLDTSGRLETVSNVYLLPLPLGSELPLRTLQTVHQDRGEIALRVGTGILQENHLYRFEVHAGGWAASDRPITGGVAVDVLPVDGPVRSIASADPRSRGWRSGQYLQVCSSDVALSVEDSVIKVTTEPVERDGRLVMQVDKIPLGVSGSITVRTVATILWSKDNAFAVFHVDGLTKLESGTRLDLGYFGNRNTNRASTLHEGDTVVITCEDDINAFSPGMLTTIRSINTDVPDSITVEVPISIDRIGRRATLRRWDGELYAQTEGAGKEAGDLVVRFSDIGTYRSGDYWQAELRPDATDPLNWPVDRNHVPVMQQPQGIVHVYAPLAYVTYDSSGSPRKIDDRRYLMSSIADIAGGVERALGHREMQPREPRAEERSNPVVVNEHFHTIHETKIERVQEALPRDALFLGRTAPDGFSPTGSSVIARVDQPQWETIGHAPRAGAAHAVVIGEALFLIFDDDATLYTRSADGTGNGWQRCATIPEPRAQFALCAGNGKLFVVGGRDERGRPSRSITSFDPVSGWTVLPPMRRARARAFSAVYDEVLYVFGGVRRSWGREYLSRTAEAYDTVARRWFQLEPMDERRASAAALVVGANMYVIGGVRARGIFDEPVSTARIDRFVPRLRHWSSFALLEKERDRPRASVVGDEFFVFGDGTTAERVSIATGATVSMHAKTREEPGIAAFDGTVYSIAGTGFHPVREMFACTVYRRYSVFSSQTTGRETPSERSR